jgi:hypothetical protein
MQLISGFVDTYLRLDDTPGFLTDAQSLCLCRGAGEQGSRGELLYKFFPLCPSASSLKLVRNAGYRETGLSSSNQYNGTR